MILKGLPAMPWRVRRKGAPDTLATGHQVFGIARPAGIDRSTRRLQHDRQCRRGPDISLLQCEADQSREVAMQQHQDQTRSQRFQQYRASKTALFWSCAGSVVVATIVGFSWGGWTTGGSAQDDGGQGGRERAPGAGRGRVRRPLHGRAGRGRPADRAAGDHELLRAEQVRRGRRLGNNRARQQHG